MTMVGLLGLSASGAGRAHIAALVAIAAALLVVVLIIGMPLPMTLKATGYGIMTHNRDRPQMVEQLRVILNGALNQEWQELMDNRQSGVMAGVYYLSGQVEDSLMASAPPPQVKGERQEPLLLRLPP